MELHIDTEYEELIPPLTSEEFKGLEDNILENGFNPAFPIVTWNNTIVDGHNRYNVCNKHGIEFTTIAQEFSSRSAVLIWIIDNQLARRNINDLTRNYLLGTRYGEEKKSRGRNWVLFPHSEGINETAEKLAKQSNVGHATVERAGNFAKNVNKIVENTGISRKEILMGVIKSTMRDIENLVKLSPEMQNRVIKVTRETKTDIKDGMKKVEKEERERVTREIEENERHEREARKREREERERIEIERIKAERAEKERIENERIEKERLAREKAKKEKAEKERVRKEQLEKEKIERAIKKG
ncbi:MAG: ParB N-terminal domain-containing protein [Methanosarcina sp.]